MLWYINLLWTPDKPSRRGGCLCVWSLSLSAILPAAQTSDRAPSPCARFHRASRSARVFKWCGLRDSEGELRRSRRHIAALFRRWALGTASSRAQAYTLCSGALLPPAVLSLITSRARPQLRSLVVLAAAAARSLLGPACARVAATRATALATRKNKGATTGEKKSPSLPVSFVGQF